MERSGAEVVELRPAVESAFNEQLDRKLAGTVWNTGCSSWYLDAGGRNAALWPDWTWRFRRRTARFDAERYELVPPSPSPPSPRPQRRREPARRPSAASPAATAPSS